LLFSQSS